MSSEQAYTVILSKVEGPWHRLFRGVNFVADCKCVDDHHLPRDWTFPDTLNAIESEVKALRERLTTVQAAWDAESTEVLKHAKEAAEIYVALQAQLTASQAREQALRKALTSLEVELKHGAHREPEATLYRIAHRALLQSQQLAKEAEKMNEREEALLTAAMKVLSLRRNNEPMFDSCPICDSVQPFHIELDSGAMCPLQALLVAVQSYAVEVQA